MKGGRGHGDFGGPFGGATADGATRAITNATSLITLVKSDLAYATGKMDTADVQRWVNGAETLLASAQSANGSSQYGKAVSYAQAARELAMTADSKMALALGAANLPSNGQLPQRGDKGTSANTTVTQAQASRILAETYNRLLGQATIIKSASNASEATPYLTDAQNSYKTAYDAYQAGKYSDVLASARLAEKLSHVAEAIVRASTAPANADTPVTVPAPNF
jgi:HEPN domain-containing protein